MSAADFLARLDGVQGRGPWRAICPAHHSRHGTRSLSIREDGERVLFRCFADCDKGDILGAVGLDWSAVMPPRNLGEHKPIQKPWRVSDALHALRGDLFVAAIILSDVGAGKELSDEDRTRAKESIERIGLFLEELDHAA